MKFGLMYYKRTDNIGDDFQTYAARRFLKHVDYYIDREAMNAFIPDQKEYVTLLMNGWYMNNKLTWPPSPYIYPHFVSMHFTDAGLFNVGDKYIEGKVSNYLNKYEKIGCRDTETKKRLEKYGVKGCYFTGCLTLTLNKFEDVKKQDYICLVDVKDELVEKVRQSTKKEIKILTQNNYNLVNMSIEERMQETERVLKTLQGASLVITRRLHAMLPSIALETPVILLRQDGYENEKDRFQDFIKFPAMTYTNKEFLEIDISEIINNPKPNSGEHLAIRENLIKSCEEFVKKCEEINLDTEKLPDIEMYKKEKLEEAEWYDRVGAELVENEKQKQLEYVENWDEREKYWLKQKCDYEENLTNLENCIKNIEEQNKKEIEKITNENKELKNTLSQIYNSKSWKMLEKMRKIKKIVRLK